jgi:F-type H+-transporting ATPase subunit delta
MSADSRVAVRYAKSLVSLAIEQNKLEIIKDNIEAFNTTCVTTRELVVMLKNPIINEDKKFKVLSAIFESHFDKLVLSFFKLVCTKGRADVLLSIAHEIIQEYNLIQGIQEAEIVTSSPLDSNLLDEFKRKVEVMTNKKVYLKEIIDPTLIGGYILKIGDKQVDTSISKKLKRMKNQFA